METSIATPVDYAKLMAEAAAAAAKTERAPSALISFKSGILAIDDRPIPGNKIKCVLLGGIHENDYFPGKFDPNTPVSPDCWALSRDEYTMAPTDEVTNKQNDTCYDCPRNQWPATRGQPKDCKNIRRVALVDAKILASDDALSAKVWYARLPVTSVGNWKQYVVQVANVVNRPTWGVITELSVVPDVKSQFKVNFLFQGLVPDNRLEILSRMSESELNDGLWFPYPKNVAKAEEPAELTKRSSKKF